jgi:preprotein translocase subunit SecF
MKQNKDKDDDIDSKLRKKRKSKKLKKVKTEEEEEESEFKKETDPSKIGKALSDSINKKTIIGVLFMLMVLPILSYTDIDYSGHYTLREAFWFGISSCRDPNGFFCNPNEDG